MLIAYLINGGTFMTDTKLISEAINVVAELT